MLGPRIISSTITAGGARNPRANRASPPLGSFAAWFAEVRVDADLGLLRLARIVSAVDAGRVLNEKLARSQVIGGAVMAIGMTVLEENVFDLETGRITNATFGDCRSASNSCSKPGPLTKKTKHLIEYFRDATGKSGSAS